MNIAGFTLIVYHTSVNQGWRFLSFFYQNIDQERQNKKIIPNKLTRRWYFAPYLACHSLKSSNLAIFWVKKNSFHQKIGSECVQKLIGTVISDPWTAKCDIWTQFWGEFDFSNYSFCWPAVQCKPGPWSLYKQNYKIVYSQYTNNLVWRAPFSLGYLNPCSD